MATNQNRMENNLQTLEQLHRMASYILELMRYFPATIMSWGIDNRSYRLATDADGNYGLQFHVQGFKHTGTVQILYDEGSDMFLYHLRSDTGDIVKTREGICFDELISVVVDHHDGSELLISSNKGGFKRIHIDNMEFTSRNTKGYRLFKQIKSNPHVL